MEKQNSTKELKVAIEALDGFSRKKEKSKAISLIKKTITFGRKLLFNTFRMKENQIHHKFHCVESEKNNLASLIEKKTPSEQELCPSKQEIDAFRMKAITLLNHHEVRFSSLTEQLQMIREVPIVLTKNNLLSKCSIAMRQTLSILPGETIELKGEFKRSSIGHSFSVPIQDSFHIVTQSKQTGFPHPSQHHGWALSKALLPQEHPLTNNLQEMAGELMPEGCLNRQAKELLKIKKQCFESNVNSFLKLHRELIEALLKMAKLDSKWVVDQFFTKMINQNNIFQSLSQIHQQINSIYLESSGNLSSFTAPVRSLTWN